MKSRILKTKLAEPLARHMAEQEHTKTALAKRIGVSPQKLTAMMSDRWDYITRDALERVADFLGLDVTEVFELVAVDFWQPITDTKKAIFLRGSQAPIVREEYLMPRYDEDSTQVVKKFMRRNLPECDKPPVVEHDRQDEAEVMNKAGNLNCIVIGSPKTNAATEIILSRFFDAAPFTPGLDNRLRIPFGFCWPENSKIVETSSLTCSAIARREVQNRPGIAVLNGPHVEADYKPWDEYLKWSTRNGRDCGLVFVANRPFGSEQINKLIVLAGFGGIGTLAAANALVQDFRYLEPLKNEKYFFGIVEGKYQKRANTSAREYRSFRWKYRKGGHAPLG